MAAGTVSEEKLPLIEELRARAVQAYERLSWPQPKSEEYRRSDISFLKSGFDPIAESAEWELSSSLAETLLPLQEGLRRWGPVLGRHLMNGVRPEDGKLQAQHGRHLGDGVSLYLPPGQTVVEPIRIHRRLPREGAYFPHALIALGEGSAGLVLMRESSAPGAHFLNSATEIFLGAGARLVLVILEEENAQTSEFSFISAVLEKEASLQICFAQAGAGSRRLELLSRSQGPGAQVDVLGSCLIDGSARRDVHVTQRHEAPATHSNMLWKSALLGKTKVSFLGNIVIAKGADGSEAFQTIDNLLLSPQAEANPDPRLEILANEVKAKHSATVGHLGEEEMFYLVSRGVEPKEAERLMSRGYLSHVFERLPPPAREELVPWLEQRVGEH